MKKSFEEGGYEQDPGYDPERPDSLEKIELPRHSDDAKETAPQEAILQLAVEIPEYTFHESENPYRFDASPQASLSRIAHPIDAVLSHYFTDKSILLRGFQSAKHSERTRGELLRFIMVNGLEYELKESEAIYAAEYAPFDNSSSVESILAGFHTYKPKCDELPQYPVDIWMIYDASRYEAAPYMHPRHGVLTRDRYQLMPGYIRRETLKACLVVN